MSEGWPNGWWCDDVVFVVDQVVLMLFLVVICVGCDGGNHGEVLVIFGGVAGWSGDGCGLGCVV